MKSRVPDPRKLAWLQQLYARWYAARGKGVKVHVRDFRYDWNKLLDEAGLHTAAEQSVATHEAEALEKDELVVLYRHKHRKYLIERIGIPISAESEIGTLFSKLTLAEMANASLPILLEYQKKIHPRYPALWENLCKTLIDAVPHARSIEPFDWCDLSEMALTLDVLYQLTMRDWPPATPIRMASVAIGLESKWLECHRRKIEKSLSVFFDKPTTIVDLGILAHDYLIEISGPLTLHFDDGKIIDFCKLQSHYAVAASDIARCVRATTPAQRLLSIENSKTTFRQFSAANDHNTLLVASSYPTIAFRNLLEKLPAQLPIYHFGDTDPSGWHIFAKIRELCRADARVFAMKYRAAHNQQSLSAFDKSLLPKLLVSPYLSDVYEEIRPMIECQSKGNFEQETIGAPTVSGWPFFSDEKIVM